MAYSLLEISYTIVTTGLLVFAVVQSKKTTSQKKLFLIWGVFGFLFTLYSFSWLYTVYPLTWLDDGLLQYLGLLLIHVIIATLGSLSFVLTGASFLHTKKHFAPIVFGALLMGGEVIRSLLLSILFFGKGTTLQLHFSAGSVGNALSSTPLIELAYLGGPFALAFILGIIVYTLTDIKTYHYYFYIILTVFVVIHFFAPINSPPHPLTVQSVSTYIKTPTKETFKENKQISKENILSEIYTTNTERTRPDIIILPEDARLFTTMNTHETESLLKEFPSTLFIDGNSAVHNDNIFNISAYYVGKGVIKTSAKEFLLPFNEYLPYSFKKIFLLFITEGRLDAYMREHTYTPLLTDKTTVHASTTVATFICSELLSHATLRRTGGEGLDLIIYQSRLNVFHNNPWFIMHLYSFTKISAATLRTPLISSTNYAPSFYISPRGKILKSNNAGTNSLHIHF